MKQLKTLDENIKKWQVVVYDKIFTKECSLCDENNDCNDCIICQVTGVDHCLGTPFYGTTVFYFSHNSEIPENSKIYDNLMLSKIYEIRLAYINGFHAGIYE